MLNTIVASIFTAALVVVAVVMVSLVLVHLCLKQLVLFLLSSTHAKAALQPAYADSEGRRIHIVIPCPPLHMTRSNRFSTAPRTLAASSIMR
jgi:hypothetical protein